MKIRTRLILSFALLVGVGFYFLTDYILDGLRPRYLESVEEVLVDQANMLASIVETQIQNGEIDTRVFAESLSRASTRSFSARIYQLNKTRVEERIYVTDAQGRVLFDSDQGKEQGKDYSNWRDVYLTLRGEYGARTTRGDPDNPSSSVLHVAAPIRWQDKIVGVLIVSKSTANINFFIQSARPQILIAGGVAALSVLALGILLSLWVTRPIQKLTGFAQSVRDGKKVALPKLGHSEMQVMGKALQEMREALEGKNYVERYVQNLTHELKSPLAAVRGAAELMQENMPAEERERFLGNILRETERMSRIVERMLALSALEARRGLQHVEVVTVKDWVEEVLQRLRIALQKKNLRVALHLEPGLTLRGEKFLLEEALTNLLQNALEFSPAGAELQLRAQRSEQGLQISVENQGPSIPDYALSRVFEKFFSLPRPDSGQKSTGLGLSFVNEIMELHQGTVSVSNQPQGVRAQLNFPAN